MVHATVSKTTSARLLLAIGLLAASTAHALAQGPADDATNAGLVSSSLEAPPAAVEALVSGPQQSTQGSMQAYPYTIQRTHSYWATHGFDLAASVNGRYQQVITDQRPALTNPTEGLGVLASVREQVVPWFGVELNYGFNHYSERFTSFTNGASIGRVQQDQHEATAGYILHIKAPGIQPFITLGGGGLNFRGTKANPQFGNQWRGTYMYEVGFDFISRKHPHFGVRVQEHGLFYKAPDFHVAELRSNGYIHQAMPSAGVFFRF
jgi:hypothetical protein